MTTPAFILIGAQKAASTWLHLRLREHPQVFMGPKNRIRYFQYPEHNERQWSWYLDQLTGAQPGQLVGDSRVEYLYQTESPGLIAQHLPDAKLLVSLRDPTERAHSALLWAQRRKLVPLGSPAALLNEALESWPNRPSDPRKQYLTDILAMGCYREQLDRYLDHFAPTQLWLALVDDVRERPRQVIESAFSFLGVATDFEPTGLHERPVKAIGTPWLIRAERATMRIPGALHALRLLNHVLESLGIATPPRPMDPQLRHELGDFYRPHNRLLLEFMKAYSRNVRIDTNHLRFDARPWLTG